MPERGVIRSRDFATQIRDFSGLRFGNITPTDIDAFLDFKDRLFVFVESKFGGAKLPTGQQMALERLCDACHQVPKRYAVVLHATHWTHGDIDFALQYVVRYRWNGRWITPSNPITVKDAVDDLIKRVFIRCVSR